MSKSICLDIRCPEQAASSPHPGAYLIDHRRLSTVDYLVPLVNALRGYQRIFLLAADKKKACEFRTRLMRWGYTDVVCASGQAKMEVLP